MKKVLLLLLVVTFIAAFSYSQSITVTNPKSGDVWCKGKKFTITWTKNGNMNSTVKIRLMKNGTKLLGITDATPNDKEYVWTVPTNIADGTYQIRVKTVDNQVSDDSDFFQISSCFANPVLERDILAGMDLTELAIYMHGPGPRIKNFGEIRSKLEKANFRYPVTLKLYKGNKEIANLGTFRPVVMRGRVSFNTMPASLDLNLSPRVREMMIKEPEGYRIVFFSNKEMVGELGLVIKAYRKVTGRPDLITKINPKIIKDIKAAGCPDLAVVDIKFSIVQRYSTFRGKVRISGVVKNIGKADYISRPGSQMIVLDAGDAAHPLKTVPFTNLKMGQSITISYETDWDSASPNEGEFPPTFRVYLSFDPDISMDSLKTNDDCNPSNNHMSKSGVDINKMLK